ncbi:hypothetical protein FOXB_05585, partial [Fusarium oxysporum f. sp. conglutinans Fo5176]
KVIQEDHREHYNPVIKGLILKTLKHQKECLIIVDSSYYIFKVLKERIS